MPGGGEGEQSGVVVLGDIKCPVITPQSLRCKFYYVNTIPAMLTGLLCGIHFSPGHLMAFATPRTINKSSH